MAGRKCYWKFWGIPEEPLYDTVDTGVSSLGLLVPLIKDFKNGHKLKLEGNSLELKGKTSRQAAVNLTAAREGGGESRQGAKALTKR